MKPVTLSQIAPLFDAYLIDQFGVLLDGTGAYAFAPKSLSRLSACGKPIMLLSNSGKRAAANEARLTRLGFDRTAYLGVMSSGEAAFSALSRRVGQDIPASTRVWVHGRDDDTSAVDGLGLVQVETANQAGLLILAGSQGDQLTLSDYCTMLNASAQAKTPMICTNPDLEMLTPHGIRFGAGQIARTYAQMGGPVEWIGKPHPLIYAEAMARLPGIAPARVLCIGDSPAHDIAGGQAAGHATALVRTGLHAGLSSAELAALCAAEGAMPDYVIPAFEFSEG